MYVWLKTLHVIAFITWMAGLLYLPRLFVYSVDAPAGWPASETFKIMEPRLLKAIINPSMVVVFVTGPLLAYLGIFGRNLGFRSNLPSSSDWARCTAFSRSMSNCSAPTPIRVRPSSSACSTRSRQR